MGPDGAIGPRSGPDQGRGAMAACALTARPTSQANPAVHYDWWLGLLVCSRPGFGCSVGPRRAPLAQSGPDRAPIRDDRADGCKHLKRHPTQNRLCTMIAGLDWWFACGRASVAASGPDDAVGPRWGPMAQSGPDRAPIRDGARWLHVP